MVSVINPQKGLFIPEYELEAKCGHFKKWNAEKHDNLKNAPQHLSYLCGLLDN
jgi:hypothetical protein